MYQGHYQKFTALSTCLLLILGNVQANEATTTSQIIAAPPEESHPVILLANQRSVDKINMLTNESIPIVDVQGKVTGVDYIHDANLVFWTDASHEKINSVNLTAGNRINSVITTGLIHPEGIAVDWIYEHIYWTDSIADIIGVCDLQGTKRKTLFDSGLDEPRPIAVDPIDGWLFWADWGNVSKLERAGMDGCCRESIITTDIIWPNGLALDYVDKRIFWADGQLGTLSSAKYDGSERRALISDRNVIQQSFGMDVFQDVVYWSEWTSKALHSANKLTGHTIATVYTGDTVPMGLRVFHPLKHPQGHNYCKSLSEHCSAFCFPTPRIASTSSNITCACPNGKVLAEDGLNCENQVTE